MGGRGAQPCWPQMVQTPRQGPRRPGRPRKEQPAPVQWSPVTERLCERALELAAEHKAKPPGSELSPGARSILLQLRAAIRAKKPCRFTGVGQLEEKFRLSQGYISRMAQEQSHSGRLLSGLRAGRPADWWEDKDGWYKKMAAALKKGRGQRRGTSAWFLSKELGKSEDWCRRHRKRFFKRFTPQWKPALTKANVAKRLKASKKHVAFYKKRGWKSQVIIHEDEKWFIRGAPQAIWAGKDEPPVFKHSPRVAKLQREKIMVHATVSNVPGAAKISLVFCEKDKVAQKNSKHHKRHDVYKVDRRVDGVFYREILSETVFPAVEEKIADPSIPAFKAPVWHFKDNAPPHVAKLTTEFLSEYAEDETIVPHPIPQAPRCPESNVLDMSVFNWLQQCVDSAEVVTREEIKAETLRAWNDMPESVILNSFNHLEPVHKTIVELQGGNRTNQ